MSYNYDKKGYYTNMCFDLPKKQVAILTISMSTTKICKEAYVVAQTLIQTLESVLCIYHLIWFKKD